jgi:hypothetical protein
MNTLVLIGLALVVAGVVLLAMRLAPRVRRQVAASAAQPRTVADLVRLREQNAAPAGQAAAPAATPRRAAAAQAARPEPPAPRAAPATPAVAASAPAPAATRAQAPAFVPPPPRPTPVAGRVRREPADLPAAPLDGDNSPWQRGARMAVGLGGGQPWREPPAPPAPLRIVPAAPPPAPAEAAAPAPMRLVPQPGSRTDAPEEIETPARENGAEQAPVRLVPDSPEPAPAEPVAQREAIWTEPGADAAASAEPAATAAPAEQQAPPEPVEPVARQRAVWTEPGADDAAPAAETATGTAPQEATPAPPEPTADERAAEPGADVAAIDHSAEPGTAPAEQPSPPEPATPQQSASTGSGENAVGTGENVAPAEPDAAEGAVPIPDGWDDVEAEDVPVGAVPDRFAEEPPAARAAEEGRRRSRLTPDERAAEQAAADLALLRTFGFADPGLRPDSAPVVAMERPGEQEPAMAAGDAQPVRYRVVRRDGAVVGGATVTLLDDRGGDVAAGAADDEGRGVLVAPSPGGYVLVSTAPGHQPGAVAVTVSAAMAETDVLIARSASVSGSVHGEDGPIAGARVTLVQDGEAVDAVDTDADGAYRIGDIGAGAYGLSVAAPGCEPVATLLEVADEVDLRHDVELKPASPVADSDLVETTR